MDHDDGDWDSEAAYGLIEFIGAGGWFFTFMTITAIILLVVYHLYF